tara:strand:- start:4302 stop:4457 length:156 start_codon:yes stop_codon:yes gene_type:complete
MLKLCNYIEADELRCCIPVKNKHCKRHTCECGLGKPAFLKKCRKCIPVKEY